ncbi:membrane protein [Gordonia phage GRU1]|uniref:DUF732 domain-containing protein n=1 Tax=Gordonia phage GRU1 TaxID=1109710 RepID=G8EK31_9CAUD|nr:membrane protein [Gordonia phage GRU1]AET09913.1 hypothetical protein [Gordonia phage GRU1]
MRITTPDGRILGHVTLTGDDVATLAAGVADTVDDRARRLIADTRRAAIASAGGWTPGPRQHTTPLEIPDRPRRRRPWWLYLVVALVVVGVLVAIADGDETAPTSAPSAGMTTIAPQPINAPRAMPGPDGSIVIGSTAVDNVYREGSPLRKRFAASLISDGVAGTVGTELDANVRAGISFCHAMARGDLHAVRQMAVVTGTAAGAESYGIGKQQRAIVTGALAALCPAL